jgi:hypothetical protein
MDDPERTSVEEPLYHHMPTTKRDLDYEIA